MKKILTLIFIKNEKKTIYEKIVHCITGYITFFGIIYTVTIFAADSIEIGLRVASISSFVLVGMFFIFDYIGGE